MVGYDSPPSKRALGPEGRIPRLAEAIFDSVRSQVDLILLSSQIRQIQAHIDEFTAHVSGVSVVSAALGGESALAAPVVLEFLGLPTIAWESRGRNYIPPPAVLHGQFSSELCNAHGKFLLLLHSVLERCLVRRVEDGTQRTLIETWKRYLGTAGASMQTNGEAMRVVALMARGNGPVFGRPASASKRHARCHAPSKRQPFVRPCPMARASAMGITGQKREAIRKVNAENDELREKNAEIRVRIAQLESVKKKKGLATTEFMEEVVKTRGPTLRAKSRFSGKITRPIVAIRAVTRVGLSHS
jgi:hypothetical protein